MGKRKATPADESEFMDAETADIIAGDLPDGAYFAMMGELTGMDPIDAMMDLMDDDDDDDLFED